MPQHTTANLSPNHTSTNPSVCPECLGAREYAYREDPTGQNLPFQSRNDTGWHDGAWFKRCWMCRGTGARL